MASQPVRPATPARPANDRFARSGPTVVLMPFEDAEEERLWDEIVEERARRS